MKEFYEKPGIEIIALNADDIITSSLCPLDQGNGDGGGEN
jgi:hypothetical protein